MSFEEKQNFLKSQELTEYLKLSNNQKQISIILQQINITDVEKLILLIKS